MSESEAKTNAYNRLTPQRKALVDQVMKNLEEGTGLWKQGWRTGGAPVSATTGKPYRGINNLYLTLSAMSEGYGDNRWATFHQMEENGWTFKTDEEGNTLAKGKARSVEFFELRDRETKKKFDKSVLDGMSLDEKQEYIDKNIYPVRKYYNVFNADLIDGIPAKETFEIDEATRSQRAEDFISFWSETESPIEYQGDYAYYSPSNDKIRLPKRENFKTAEDYYSTAMHEIGHSTGHKSRLNRDLSGRFGSPEYATEELRAEIASLFIEQEFGIEVDEHAVRNNAAYIGSWKAEIEEDPDALFKAITDADRIAKYIVEKEKSKKKEAKKYAIVKGENAVGATVYRVYMKDENGQTALALNAAYESLEDLKEDFEDFQQTAENKDVEFQEVSYEELTQENSNSATATEDEKIVQDASEEYIRPSEIVARAAAVVVAVDMTERGVESLTRMSDRDVVDKARSVKGGDTFEKLYNGEKVFESEGKDEKILMMRIGMFCNGDTEQAVRVFKSSGMFREDKPNSYYMELARQSIQSINTMFEKPPIIPANTGKGKFGINAKT